MKTSCKIIEDLLPLYVDDVCSPDSRGLVEEHLAECPRCLAKLKAMTDNRDVKTDIRPLKSMGRWLERLRLKTLIKGVINGVVFTSILVFGYFFTTEFTFLEVPADRVTVSDVCMLSDGNIAFHMYIDDNYDLNAIGADIDSEGNMYITPERSIFENRRFKDFDMGLFNTYYGVEVQEYGSDDDNPYLDFAFSKDDEPNAVYLRLRGEDVLIWEKGMELPPASEEVEDRYIDPDINWEGNG